MNVTFKNLRLTFTALVCVTAAGIVQAAAEPAGNGPSALASDTAIQELDEILVRSMRVREAIATAEDEFFSLYNTLNKDDDYSTSCVFIPIGDTRIRSHICIPGFMADAMADQIYFASQCKTLGGDLSASACYTPPSPQAVLTQRSTPYANHLMKVIRSDERLGQMAGNLDNLYHELVSIQQRYIDVKTGRVPTGPNQGPRLQ